MKEEVRNLICKLQRMLLVSKFTFNHLRANFSSRKHKHKELLDALGYTFGKDEFCSLSFLKSRPISCLSVCVSEI